MQIKKTVPRWYGKKPGVGGMVPDEHVHIQQINKSVQKQSEEDLVLFFASPERKKQVRGKLKSQYASYLRFTWIFQNIVI